MASKKVFDTEAFLTTVGVGRTIGTYKAKSYVFRQGKDCDAVFYIQDGHVELSVVSQQGKERVVGMLGPGSFIGEGCLAGHPRYLASARATTEAIVARVDTPTLRQAIKDHPQLSERFMAFLLLRNSQVEADLSTSFLIRARSVSHACSSCWRRSGRKQNCALSPRRSASK